MGTEDGSDEDELYRQGREETTEPEDEEPAAEEAEPEPEEEEEPEGYLSVIPEWFVPLGAGCLFTSTLITAGMGVLVGYLLATGQALEFARYKLVLGLLQFGALTVLQGVGVYLARKRMRWMVTMIAAILGSTALVTLPFSIPAVVLLGLTRHHFRIATPADTFSE